MKTFLKALLVLGILAFTSRSEALMYPARTYDPNLGRWISRDPIGENDGANLYEVVGNDVVNNLDPLGLERFRIWASAYIPDATFRFPYPEGGDRSARWYGDNRTGAQDGGSARAYHFIVIETDPSLPATVSNLSNGGLTKVDYNPSNWLPVSFPTIGDFWKPLTAVANDVAPPRATITRSSDNHITTVTFSADTTDPLVHLAPSLHYNYTLVFNTCSGRLKITGSHKKYPGYDLIVKHVTYVNYVPSGIYNNPAALALPIQDAVDIPPVSIQKY